MLEEPKTLRLPVLLLLKLLSLPGYFMTTEFAG